MLFKSIVARPQINLGSLINDWQKQRQTDNSAPFDQVEEARINTHPAAHRLDGWPMVAAWGYACTAANSGLGGLEKMAGLNIVTHSQVESHLLE